MVSRWHPAPSASMNCEPRRGHHAQLPCKMIGRSLTINEAAALLDRKGNTSWADDASKTERDFRAPTGAADCRIKKAACLSEANGRRPRVTR